MFGGLARLRVASPGTRLSAARYLRFALSTSRPCCEARWWGILIMATCMLPFHTFLFKIASRCNINCSYCYIYNQADGRWARQPKLMSRETARQTTVRIRDHLSAHEKADCSLVFHGGEPLMGGLSHLTSIVNIVLDELIDRGISVSLGLQSNGMLFDREIGDFMRAHGMSMGVSMDGPPEVNDRFRLDHQGRPTTARLEPRLRTLAEEYPDVFSGFLCVIDPFSDPLEVTKYLLSYNPSGIDFLFPLNNHSVPPRGKTDDLTATPYGDWLIAAYDYWADLPEAGTVRIFNSIINMWLGQPTLVESLGLLPVQLGRDRDERRN